MRQQFTYYGSSFCWICSQSPYGFWFLGFFAGGSFFSEGANDCTFPSSFSSSCKSSSLVSFSSLSSRPATSSFLFWKDYTLYCKVYHIVTVFNKLIILSIRQTGWNAGITAKSLRMVVNLITKCNFYVIYLFYQGIVCFQAVR